MPSSPAASSTGAPTGQAAPDTRDTGLPSRDPPGGYTMIALSPAPARNNDGALVGPGGPVSDQETDCGASAQKCLRGSYFAKGGEGMVPVYLFEGRFHTWDGKFANIDFAYRNVPATAQTLANARIAVVFKPRRPYENHLIPRSEDEALVDGFWLEVNPKEVNAADGTFEHSNTGIRYKFEQARALLDWIKDKPE